jgi:hypothetical protein
LIAQSWQREIGAFNHREKKVSYREPTLDYLLMFTDALHNVARLLSIEARPFGRISGRVVKKETFSEIRPTHLPSPPPDVSAVEEEAAARETEREQEIQKIEVWRSDVMNDLGLLDYTTLRFELTTESNNDERERFAQEKIAITQKQEHVKQAIERLRIDLVEAKETLAVRKSYDELTEKITNSKMLKPRDEQAVAHAKLDEEIAELEHEVQTAKDTWNERRVQFNRIEEEAKEMLRMIKDEKEEAERKEGMMKDRDDEGEISSTRGDVSHAGTPRPDGGMTPVHTSQAADNSNTSTLKVPQNRLAPLSRDSSVAPSLARSGAAEDNEMVESSKNLELDEDMVADESSGIEEGEDLEDGEDDGEMDLR